MFKEIIAEQVGKLPLYDKLPVAIHYEYYLKRKWTDLNNVHSTISKFFPDVLVEMGKLPDDTTEEIIYSTERFCGYDKDNPRAEIYLDYKY